MISNNDLRQVDDVKKLIDLFNAFGISGAQEKISFIERITNHKIGRSGSTKNDLLEAAEFFLAHEWQSYA